MIKSDDYEGDTRQGFQVGTPDRRILKLTPVGSAREVLNAFKEIKEAETKTYYQRLREELKQNIEN